MPTLSTACAALLFANFAWFGAGFIQFTLRARTAFTKGIRRAPGSPRPSHADHAADIFRYLGAMNGALALSNLPKLVAVLKSNSSEVDKSLPFLFWLWGSAHASQAITTLSVVAPSQRWYWDGLGLGFITYVDLLLWGANYVMWIKG